MVCLKPIGIIARVFDARVFNSLSRKGPGGREFGKMMEWAGLARTDQVAVMCPETCGEYGAFAPGCTPPPSPPPTSPPLPPTSPPLPPANSQVHPHWHPHWALLPVYFVLFACCVAAISRRHHRLLQDRANLRISRDRAQVDLQMHLHQAQNVQNTDGSLASSTRRVWRLPSLPPGPPSSASRSDTQRSAAGEMDVEPSNDGNRPSNPAPSSVAPASSSGPVRSQPLEELATLAEMADVDDVEPESASSEQERAALAEMADLMEDASTAAAQQELAPDEETVAIPQDIVGPGRGCVALPRWVSLVRVPVGIPWAAPLPAAGGATPNEPFPPPRPLASLQASAPPPRVPTAPLSYLDRRMGALPRLHRHSARPVALPPAAPLITPPASPVALSTPPAAPPPLPAKSGIFMQRFCTFGEDESELHSVFAQLFTPKDPSTLPTSLSG